VRVILDTSAVNRLADDPDADLLIKGLESAGVFLVTALNIYEASQTSDLARREKLRALLHRLWRQRGPLALPNSVLREELRAHAAGSERASVGGIPEDFILAEWLSHPGEDGENIRDSYREWASVVVSLFDRVHEGMRETLYPVFEKRPRQHSASSFLRFYWNNKILGITLASELARRAYDISLSDVQARSLLEIRPCWSMHSLTFAYTCYRRGVRSSGYGKGANAGVLDLWSSVYLPLGEFFVTADENQRKALRYIAVFLPSRPLVLSYRQFKERLLPPSLMPGLTPG
jgi:hypothetical protein